MNNHLLRINDGNLCLHRSLKPSVLLPLKCSMWPPEVLHWRLHSLSSLSPQLHCCGVHNFTSWLGSAYFPASGIPASCCISFSDCSSADLRNATVAARKVHKQVGKKDSPDVGGKKSLEPCRNRVWMNKCCCCVCRDVMSWWRPSSRPTWGLSLELPLASPSPRYNTRSTLFLQLNIGF